MSNDSPATPPVALLILDMQDGFLKAIPDAPTLINRVKLSAAAARLFNLPILITEQSPEKLGPTHAPLLELTGDDVRLFSKTTFSAYGADGFADYLEKHGIEHLLIVGIETPICVYQTALAASDHGQAVTLLSDGLGARRADDARAALAALSGAGCHLLPTETVFYSLLGDATAPAFRTFTQLVKNHYQP
jgi:nicotinamidase-related amidase